MNDIERLAVEQAVFKAIAEDVSTSNRDGLRGRMDEQFRALYEESGVKSRVVRLNGQKVGTYSIRLSKETEQSSYEEFQVDSYEKLAKWADGLTEEEVRHYVSMHLRELAEFAFGESGEMPDGCSMHEIIVPATDSVYQGTVLKVDPQAVIRALPDSAAPIRYFLEGGTV